MDAGASTSWILSIFLNSKQSPGHLRNASMGLPRTSALTSKSSLADEKPPQPLTLKKEVWASSTALAKPPAESKARLLSFWMLELAWVEGLRKLSRMDAESGGYNQLPQ